MPEVETGVREFVRLRAAGFCEYCHISERFTLAEHEIDHVIAVKHGGQTVVGNLALCCTLCNRFKGSDIASIDPETGQIAPLFHPRIADSGGWAYATFDYDTASDTFTPGTMADKPPQGNDARCGFACHTTVTTRDYVFTDYGHRVKRHQHHTDEEWAGEAGESVFPRRWRRDWD